MLKKHDISVIDSILKVEKSVCKVKDRSGRLPGEVILHAKGDNDEYLYGMLPLELVCKLLEKKKPADLELVHEDYSLQELLSSKHICYAVYFE